MAIIKIVNNNEVIESLKMSQVIELVESVYIEKSKGNTETWPTVFNEFEKGKADLDIKSGYLKSEDIFGHKTVTWFGDNTSKNLPTLSGVIMVFSGITGLPIGVVDAYHITGMRTGAAGALGAKYLAKENSKNLLIIGAGNQAIFQIAATLSLISTIDRVQVTALNSEEVKKFVSSIKSRLEDEFGIYPDDVIFEAVEDIEAAVKDSDIIITVTPSRKPIIKKEWVQKGTHISCIGADMEGKQEIESEIMSKALIFVDDVVHCKEVGEIELPLKSGVIQDSNIIGELGDLILKKVKGRTSDEQITIYDATGMAILDIATANLVLKQAEEAGRGKSVNL